MMRPLPATGADDFPATPDAAAPALAPIPEPAAAWPAPGPAPLALLEVLERDGRVRQAVPIQAWPLHIGRALDNGLVLDDPHVAPHHAVLHDPGDGPVWLVGDTLNGLQIGRQAWPAGATVPVGLPPPGEARPVVQVGGVRLRLRLSSDPLPAERALRRTPGGSRTLAYTVALAMLAASRQAVALDPGATLVEWLGLLIAPPLAVVLWCTAWGLASKLFQHRFEFWPHWAVAVRGALAYLLLSVLLPQVAASLGWAGLSRADELVLPLVLLVTAAAHARLVLPGAGRREAIIAALAYAGLMALDVARNEQRLQRPFEELYMATLPLPALRLGGGVTPEEFVAGAAGLRERLDAYARDSADDPDAPDEP